MQVCREGNGTDYSHNIGDTLICHENSEGETQLGMRIDGNPTRIKFIYWEKYNLT